MFISLLVMIAFVVHCLVIISSFTLALPVSLIFLSVALPVLKSIYNLIG